MENAPTHSRSSDSIRPWDEPRRAQWGGELTREKGRQKSLPRAKNSLEFYGRTCDMHSYRFLSWRHQKLNLNASYIKSSAECMINRGTRETREREGSNCGRVSFVRVVRVFRGSTSKRGRQAGRAELGSRTFRGPNIKGCIAAERAAVA